MGTGNECAKHVVRNHAVLDLSHPTEALTVQQISAKADASSAMDYLYVSTTSACALSPEKANSALSRVQYVKSGVKDPNATIHPGRIDRVKRT